MFTGDKCVITHTKLITQQIAHSRRVRRNF